MKVISREIVNELLTRATTSPRKRVTLNLHENLHDPTNRFLNAGVEGTYIQPHCHRSGKWELLNIMRGGVDVFIFDAEGKVKERFLLGDGGSSLVEIPGGEWHSYVFRPPGAVVLEVKPGPYEAELDKEFARWSPREGDLATSAFLSWLEQAAPGAFWRSNGARANEAGESA